MSNTEDPTRHMALKQKSLWNQIQGQPAGFTWTWFSGKMSGQDDLGNSARLTTSPEGLVSAMISHSDKK